MGQVEKEEAMCSNEMSVGTLVWGKVKGSAWWPGRVSYTTVGVLTRPKVAERENLPEEVALSKSSRSTKTIPIYFFGTHNYCWLGRDHLKSFHENFELFSTKNKTKSFILALKEAQGEEFAEIQGERPSKRIKLSTPEDISAKTSTDRDDGESTAKHGKLAISLCKSQEESINPDAEVHDDGEKLFKLRKKLQRIFWQGPLTASNLEKANKCLTELENFSSISVDLLMATKIGKVVKKISQMSMPLDTHNIGVRSLQIIERWRAVLPLDETEEK
ncbi:hypothetical protein BC829DRAFT_305208 [Chytridium lagenaria]|nr:hypothetical protein BC829DRAFT_305208 [Chytridium lagenaria]